MNAQAHVILSFMKYDSARKLVKVMALFAAFSLSACGWASIQPDVRGPRSVHAPRSAAPAGNDAFINASAVTVGRGDTVYSIARRHKLSPRDVIEANNLRPPYELTLGQRLKLPQGNIHTVQRGDYIALIAKRYGVDTFGLARLNGIRTPYTIFPGQKLRIPRTGNNVSNVQVARRAAPPPTSTSKLWIEPQATPKPSKSVRKNPAKAKAKVSKPPARSGSKFSWPLKGKVLSGFGTKKKGLQNDGVNIAAPLGTIVKASENGVVAYAGNEIRGFGNLLLIKHQGGWVTAYAHNDILLVKRGDKVVRGQYISKVGATGSVSSPQLHFELRKGSNAVNPNKYLM